MQNETFDRAETDEAQNERYQVYGRGSTRGEFVHDAGFFAPAKPHAYLYWTEAERVVALPYKFIDPILGSVFGSRRSAAIGQYLEWRAANPDEAAEITRRGIITDLPTSEKIAKENHTARLKKLGRTGLGVVNWRRKDNHCYETGCKKEFSWDWTLTCCACEWMVCTCGACRCGSGLVQGSARVVVCSDKDHHE